MIRVEGVSHSIGRTPILHDIDLTLAPGRITALIGPNGAGKSTLLSLIARLAPLQSGRITVAGLDVAATPTRDLARVMAILPQSLNVASRLRVEELVAFGRWPHHQGRPAARDRAMVDEAIEAFTLGALRHRFLDELSGGQRQRAHLAMAFAQETEWLLLDEPLAALDMAHARALMARLAALRDQGRGVVIVVHEINFAAAWADDIVALKEGRVMAQAAPVALFTPETLGALYDTPLRVEHFEGRPLVLNHL